MHNLCWYSCFLFYALVFSRSIHFYLGSHILLLLDFLLQVSGFLYILEYYLFLCKKWTVLFFSSFMIQISLCDLCMFLPILTPCGKAISPHRVTVVERRSGVYFRKGVESWWVCGEMNQSHPDPHSSSGRLLYLPVNAMAHFSSLTATFYPSQCHLQRPCECFPAAWIPSCMALFAFAQEHPGHSLDNVTVITNISHLLAVHTIHSP